MRAEDFSVVELSSFQLQTMRRSPERAVVTNLSPNHLDWHTGMEEYRTAKQNVYLHAPCSLLVTNAENAETRSMAKSLRKDTAGREVSLTVFSSLRQTRRAILEDGYPDDTATLFVRNGVVIYDAGQGEIPVLSVSDIKLPGRHNVENYLAAIGVTWGLVSTETIRRVAQTFGGVEHRLEFVRTFEDVTYYNSSIDSSPSRTAAALSALSVKPIVICGGYDKKIPFAPLARALCENAKAVVLTGATAEKIQQALQECPAFRTSGLRVIRSMSFDAAVLAARHLAVPGDVVLLSPACASFDCFRNFEERGNRFKELVNQF
jgi:UDP-N-acetylmuramoylalanine--D-glutamate ligase